MSFFTRLGKVFSAAGFFALMVPCMAALDQVSPSAAPADSGEALRQAQNILSGGGSLEALVARLEKLAAGQTDSLDQAEVRILLSQLHLSAGDYAAALDDLRTCIAYPKAGLMASRLALVCNDDAVLKAALFPLLADPSASWYSEAREVLALQLYRTGNYAGVIETLGSSDGQLATILVYVSLANLGKTEEAQARLESAGSKGLLARVAQMDKNYEFDPLSLILFSLGDLPGLLEARDQDQTVARVAAQEKQEASAHAEAGAAASIQVGYFSSLANAEAFQKKLQKYAFQARITKEEKKAVRYKVVVDIPSGVDPQTILLSLKDKGIEGFLTK